MAPMRVRLLIPIITIAAATFFFWRVDQSEYAALTKIERPRPSLAPPQIYHSQIGPLQKTPDEICHNDKATAPAMTMGEWLTRKNYSRTYIRPSFQSAETAFGPIERIEGYVLPPLRPVNRGLKVSNSSGHWPCSPILDVNVVADIPADHTSQLLFGLATTVERLDELLPSLLYSYGNTGATILVLVPDNRDDLEAQEAYFRNRGLDVRLRPSPLPFPSRYFGLVEAFQKFIDEERPYTRWVSFVDDDTFFLSVARIASRLATLDASEKHYIGALSEASWQVRTFGEMAFGGAGIFISRGLLDALQPVYKRCLGTRYKHGDQKLSQCIKTYAKTRLTAWDSLFQMDMRGAPDGIFESGREIDSLHHWNTWYKKDVAKMSSVAVVAGRRSVLRRWLFNETVALDHTGVEKRTFWVLTNGYSLIRYTMDPSLTVESVGFDRTEKTWNEDGKGFEARLGPLRPTAQDGIQKDRWMLSDSVIIGNNVHQTYSFRETDGHSVIELVWLGDKGWVEPADAYHF
ncbi:hypothetical protein LOZ12_000461 [Ophidiomyces ophidiicola]|uniref:Uncharacterized protein n=1 Tax=Ophidiomyces ophidiicola TaxID=1387563 RepID=A0ACB8UNP0_9EURO|nr:hypothetical protein LOZ64_002199 [Ophidiomyces ophidiicola]KAI1934922.1 hypothetical protein LOZ62_006125 [Ophidiomyces ophidiicola]KAI1967466.1 hypothetical protein LOZ59_000838 [Ophidiomyces ophidiicola]KAI1974793.1 hypothetical protein LOZ56_001095 [Ophidiomyces ophidiicola]KAI2012376.1 hypothetical protein LOZ50_000299 [Ophidiomyces ophidiicola]